MPVRLSLFASDRHAIGETLINSKDDCTMFTLFIACVSCLPSPIYVFVHKLKTWAYQTKWHKAIPKLLQKNAFRRDFHNEQTGWHCWACHKFKHPQTPQRKLGCLRRNQVSHVTQRLCIYFHAFPSDCISLNSSWPLLGALAEGARREPCRDITGAWEKCRDCCAIISCEDEGAIYEHKHMFVAGCCVNPIPGHCGPTL